MLKKSWFVVFAGLLLPLLPLIAQTSQQPPTPPAGSPPVYVKAETPEQRKTRLATPEDPGVNPDPSKHYWRFGKSYHIEKSPRAWAAFDQGEGFVRPYGGSPATAEIYQIDATDVWYWVADSLPPAAEEVAPEPPDRYNAAQYETLKKIRSDFEPRMPEASGKTLRFRESSSGLPTNGSWRNALAVGDMNEDGCPDLIVPPERKGSPVPVIFLGDCKGNWKYWAEAKFPRSVDYGGVAVADFNKDGHLDLVFAVHLTGLFVFLGDGKGNFRDSSVGLPIDFPTRRVVVTDVDHDGYPDIVAISEGPTVKDVNGYAPLRAYLNRKKGSEWLPLSISEPNASLGGDWLASGNFNGDAYPDFLASSVFYGSRDVAYISTRLKTWKKLASDTELVPGGSYYFANAAGKFSSRDRDDAIISYIRYWPNDANPAKAPRPAHVEVTNIDRLSFTKKGVVRTPIVSIPTSGGIRGIATGDFDGDKNLDLIYIVESPRTLGVLLGDGHGGFHTAAVDGLTIDPGHPIYDLKVADVNNDGRPDVILMYESEGVRTVNNRGGSIQVFLNLGTEATPAASTTAAKPQP